MTEKYISDLIAYCVFQKEGPFQNIAHALKYQERKSLGSELGKRIGALMYSEKKDIDLIIPVPLHRIKHRERGFNQSEWIASGISSVINKPVNTRLIYRTKNTQSQTTLSLLQRKTNMVHAFAVSRDAQSILEGKKCLLVDDVITTGATINMCAKELIETGALSVIAASAALAE